MVMHRNKNKNEKSAIIKTGKVHHTKAGGTEKKATTHNNRKKQREFQLTEKCYE